mgnify:CR=1 FL=1
MVGQKLRFQILKRDGFSCVYCGAGGGQITLEVDHIVPHSRGGLDTEDNLATSCRTCNGGKRDMVLENICRFCFVRPSTRRFDVGETTSWLLDICDPCTRIVLVAWAVKVNGRADLVSQD